MVQHCPLSIILKTASWKNDHLSMEIPEVLYHISRRRTCKNGYCNSSSTSCILWEINARKKRVWARSTETLRWFGTGCLEVIMGPSRRAWAEMEADMLYSQNNKYTIYSDWKLEFLLRPLRLVTQPSVWIGYQSNSIWALADCAL